MKEAIATLAVRIIAATLTMGGIFVLARVAGSEGMGQFYLITTLALILSVVGRMGHEVFIMREIAAERYLRTSDLTTAVSASGSTVVILSLGVTVTLVSALLIFLSTDLIKEELNILFLSALLIAPLALLHWSAGIVRGRGLILQSMVGQALFPSAVQFIAFLLFFLTGVYSLDLIIYAFLFSNLAGVLWLFVFSHRFRVAPRLLDKLQIRLGWPFMVSTLSGILLAWSDVLVAGLFLPANEVGSYSVAGRIVMVSALFLQAVNSITAPKFAKRYSTGDMAALRSLYRRTSQLLFLVSSVFTLAIFVFAPNILSLFGEEFRIAAHALRILAVGQFINVALGNVGTFLLMTGEEKFFQRTLIFSAGLNIFLALTLVQHFGLNGVAVSTCVTTILWNVVAYLRVRRVLKSQ